jgi:hypothetical protein
MTTFVQVLYRNVAHSRKKMSKVAYDMLEPFLRAYRVPWNVQLQSSNDDDCACIGIYWKPGDTDETLVYCIAGLDPVPVGMARGRTVPRLYFQVKRNDISQLAAIAHVFLDHASHLWEEQFYLGSEVAWEEKNVESSTMKEACQYVTDAMLLAPCLVGDEPHDRKRHPTIVAAQQSAEREAKKRKI